MRDSRVGWMVEYAGTRKVYLLEGGFQAWRKSQLPVENKVVRPEQRSFRIRPVSRLLTTADEVRSDKSAQVLDVRSEGEFTGKNGRTCDKRRGQRTRARWIEWANFNDGSKWFKTRPEI